MKYQINYGNGWETIDSAEAERVIRAMSKNPTAWKFALEKENYIKIKNVEIRKREW